MNESIDVKFYDTILCKHRERTTFESPGGWREPGETISDAAKRESAQKNRRRL